MSEQDRQRWDERYRHAEAVSSLEPPPLLEHHLHLVPTTGNALDIACGRGQGALWMAWRGLNVLAVDVSPMAIARAREAAQRLGLADRCRFEVHDLDVGLPPVDKSQRRFDMILCHLFRDPGLYHEIMDRLAPGGLLAIVTLSEDGGRSGLHRATADELPCTFSDLTIHDSGHRDGRTWLVATRPIAA